MSRVLKIMFPHGWSFELFINPFHATGLFWYPLKTSENQRFQGVSKETSDMKWVNSFSWSFCKIPFNVQLHVIFTHKNLITEKNWPVAPGVYIKLLDWKGFEIKKESSQQEIIGNWYFVYYSLYISAANCKLPDRV